MAEAKKNLQGSAIIAKLFGVTERRVQQLTKEGIIPAESTRPYKYDLLKVVQAYIKYLSDKVNGKEEKTADTVKSEADKLRAEADLKQAKAKIAEMQLNELEGTMHRSEDVEAMTTDLVFAIRGAIMALPGRLAMDVSQAATAAEASEIIRSECYKILEDLANYKYDPEAYQRRVRDREGWSVPLDDEGDE
jgi:phage terminase Nu1 subunit (DNA packaging protein)